MSTPLQAKVVIVPTLQHGHQGLVFFVRLRHNPVVAIPTETRTIRIEGRELIAEAMLNNCSDLWTATVQSSGTLVATAAGTSAEAALTNVIARAEALLGAAATN